MLKAIKINADSLQYASDEIKNDKEIILETIKLDINSLQYASNELKKDNEIVLEAYKKIMETFLKEEIETRLQEIINGDTKEKTKKLF